MAVWLGVLPVVVVVGGRPQDVRRQQRTRHAVDGAGDRELLVLLEGLHRILRLGSEIGIGAEVRQRVGESFRLCPTLHCDLEVPNAGTRCSDTQHVLSLHIFGVPAGGYPIRELLSRACCGARILVPDHSADALGEPALGVQQPERVQRRRRSELARADDEHDRDALVILRDPVRLLVARSGCRAILAAEPVQPA